MLRFSENWLLIGIENSVKIIEAALTKLGENVEVALIGNVNINDYEELFNSDISIKNIIYIANSTNIVADLEPLYQPLLTLLQACIAKQWQQVPIIYVITEHAQAIRAEDCWYPAQAILWGMMKVLMREHPEFKGKCIDVESVNDNLSLLMNELLNQTSELQVAFREQIRYVGRIVKSPLADETRGRLTDSCCFKANGTYIITGGLGDIGFALVEWLLAHGARQIALFSRRATSESYESKQKVWQQQGARVEAFAIDVSNRKQLADGLTHLSVKGFSPIKGIFHAAGLVSDATVGGQSVAKYQEVLAPKVLGAWYLHELTKNQPLDYFILFSSVASLMGTAGQSNYAAANTFLDVLADYRRQQHLVGQSINWGAWAEIGYAARKGIDDDEIKQLGTRALTPQQALQCFAEIILHPHLSRISVMPMSWESYFEHWSHLSTNWHNEMRPTQQDSSFHTNFIQQLQTASPKELTVLLKAAISQEVKKAFGLSSQNTINDEQDFFEMGMDSLMALDLKNRLQTLINQPLPNALPVDYPSINLLVNYFEGVILSGNTDLSHPRAEVSTDNSILVHLKNEEGKEPLFCIHGVDGCPEPFTDLAGALDIKRSVYAIRCPELVQEDITIPTLQDRAALYISYLRDTQPKGPYHLLGWSMGGLLAIEMANQLCQQGEELGFVGVIDTMMTKKQNIFHIGYDEAVEFLHDLTNSSKDYDSTINIKVLEKNMNQGLHYHLTKCAVPIHQFIPKVETAKLSFFVKGDYESIDNFIDSEIIKVNVSGDHFSMMGRKNNELLVKYLNNYFK